jgi:hypothetical protein
MHRQKRAEAVLGAPIAGARSALKSITLGQAGPLRVTDPRSVLARPPAFKSSLSIFTAAF